MVNKLKKIYHGSLLQKLHRAENFYYRIKSGLFYRFLLKNCGKNVTVKKPLFWSPEYISIGNNVFIWPGCRIEGINQYGDKQYRPHIRFGDAVSIQQNCHITAADELSIGKDTTISFGVSIQDTDHEYQQINVNILQQPLLVKKTTIGENCFIGSGAKILAGTVLGKQCIVGTNAVVRGVFPDYCVIAGVPARIIKRYNPETREWARTNATGGFDNDSN